MAVSYTGDPPVLWDAENGGGYRSYNKKVGYNLFYPEVDDRLPEIFKFLAEE